MSARLTDGEYAALGEASWRGGAKAWRAEIERILTDRLAEVEAEIEAIKAERDEAVRQMVAQVAAHRARAAEANTALADLRAAVEALADEWERDSKTAPYTSKRAARERLRALLSQQHDGGAS